MKAKIITIVLLLYSISFTQDLSLNEILQLGFGKHPDYYYKHMDSLALKLKVIKIDSFYFANLLIDKTPIKIEIQPLFKKDRLVYLRLVNDKFSQKHFHKLLSDLIKNNFQVISSKYDEENEVYLFDTPEYLFTIRFKNNKSYLSILHIKTHNELVSNNSEE